MVNLKLSYAFDMRTLSLESSIIRLIHLLRGQTPFQGVIFHLLTDRDDINAAYVKLKENYVLFMIYIFLFLK